MKYEEFVRNENTVIVQAEREYTVYKTLHKYELVRNGKSISSSWDNKPITKWIKSFEANANRQIGRLEFRAAELLGDANDIRAILGMLLRG